MAKALPCHALEEVGQGWRRREELFQPPYVSLTYLPSAFIPRTQVTTLLIHSFIHSLVCSLVQHLLVARPVDRGCIRQGPGHQGTPRKGRAGESQKETSAAHACLPWAPRRGMEVAQGRQIESSARESSGSTHRRGYTELCLGGGRGVCRADKRTQEGTPDTEDARQK